MADRGRNPIGTSEQCAAAAALITPELLAQADEIRANWWDYHPRANLPEDRSLVAYADGIWIVEAGCVLDELVRYARVADSWPVHLVYGGIRISSDGRGEIPIAEACRHAPLRLLAHPGDIAIAEVPAPVGVWTHACLAGRTRSAARHRRQHAGPARDARARAPGSRSAALVATAMTVLGTVRLAN